MKWDYDKPTAKRTRVELELQDAFDYVHELESKIHKLEAVVDSLYFKASISHSLLVVEKVSENTLKTLNLPDREEEP